MVAQTIASQIVMQVGKRRYGVANIEEASRMFCAARDKAGTGASKTPTPLLYRPDGSLLGYVSYNGRVWSGHPRDWQPGRTPLCEAQATRAALAKAG